MFRVDAPLGPDGQPLIPADVWGTFPPAAQAMIVALAQRVAVLEAEVRALRARLGQDSTNSSRPPSSDPPWARPGRGKRRPPLEPGARRRPGGQPGHAGHFRALAPPERVDAVVDHWPARCTGCATPLPWGVPAGVAAGPAADYAPHQVTELPAVRAVVTEHRLHRVACPACGKATRAALPADVSRGACGPRLQAAVATLSGAYRLSRRQVADLCGTLLDAPVSVGSVDALCQATSAALAHPVAEAVAAVPTAPVVHADETPWKQGKDRPWLWVAVTALATVFRIAAGRDSGVIKDLVGADYGGTLITDRYAAYAWLDAAYRQVCWAHLARDWQGLADRGGAATVLGQRGVALTRDLFRVWHRFQRGDLDRAGLQAELRAVQDDFGDLLSDGQASADARAAGLCRALDRLWPALWTFVDEDGVEPTNNRAERALRPAVLWRKGAAGTRCHTGARFVERLLTVAATCKHHGRSVLAYLTAVCTAAQQGLPVPALLPATT